MKFVCNTPRIGVNSLDALKPEHWAFEGLRILEEEMVYANLVYRDYKNELAKYGDTVHVDKPGEFKGRRKGKNTAVTTQNASSTQVDVVMDQWVHVSFTLDDLEQTVSFKNLVRMFLVPAMQAEARFVDRAVAARGVDFLGNVRGGLDQLSNSNGVDYLVDLGEMLVQQKMPASGRNLVCNSKTVANFLKNQTFHEVDKSGWSRALREAVLGQLFNLNVFQDINTPGTHSGTLDTATTVDGAVASGNNVVVLDAALDVGQYCTIVGDNTPLRVTAVSTLTHTFNRSLLNSVADGVAVQPYAQGLVDLVAGYAAGYIEPIAVDGTGVPHIGQLVSFVDTSGAGTVFAPEYIIIDVDDNGGGNYDITLDRPLENALANNDVVCYGPNGEMNPVFNNRAIALVNRPLVKPASGLGTLSYVAEHNGVSMRAEISRDAELQYTRVTLDTLFGTKTLDTDQGGVLLA